MRNWRRNRILIALCAAILLIVSGCGTLSTATTTTTIATPYDDAVALMENGDYEAAIEAFEALTDAGDADQKIIECQYALGLEAMEDEEWEKAISYFAVLDYSDSADKIIECQYALGLEAMEESRWSTAISFLSNLEYEDSATKVLECQYNQGLETMDSGDWTLAIEYFTGLSYEDSETRIAECNYNLGLEAIEAGDLELAISYLDSLDYEDAADQAAACKYQLGNSALETEEWETAISYFENLDYEDSAELLEYCTREKGMYENADYDFLADLEQSIITRMYNADNDDDTKADYMTLVTTELAYVEKYIDEDFYDEDLKTAAETYVDGLELQKYALQATYTYEYQIEWLRGAVYRYGVLNELYENYDFMSDNIDFVAEYIYKYDDMCANLKAYDEIEEDIGAQMFEEDGVTLVTIEVDTKTDKAHFVLTNNTPYTYSTVFTFESYDSDRVVFHTASVTISDFSPGSSYEVSFSVGDADRAYGYTFNNYYTNVIYSVSNSEADDTVALDE